MAESPPGRRPRPAGVVPGPMTTIIDYGGAASLGDTFQAVRGHEIVDPFQSPGSADMTSGAGRWIGV